MTSDSLKLYDTVQLTDGRIGIIIEKDSDGNIMLEQRIKEFNQGSLGDSPTFDSDYQHVVKIIHHAE